MSEQKPDVDPEIGQAFYGFVASEPQLTWHDGKPRLYFKAGQEHYEYGPDGSRTKLPTTFHDVVAFRGAAKSGGEMLSKQDWFLAHGRLETSTNPNTGVESKEFIANRFGPDAARMNIEIGTPRRLSQMESPNRHNRSGRPGSSRPSRNSPRGPCERRRTR
ncbi:single-stranded DNA-binding protein [Brachybacterium paraconglomeratum]|uniref:single-stranded DNA-binding protein n=1 Tax=Brachybacterium paraconglomeratum TaxID=173362 RepID=UPI00223BFA5A|nr:hypothetical protein [Brachybacterium paraconglomeratum]MCT1438808.1 hypothetical protein [Brachybacterium paraconglomeratum]